MTTVAEEIVAGLGAEGADDAASASLRAVEPSALRFKPFIKWAGGKTRLLSRLLPHVPAVIDDYYEPFLGGGAMFFAVRERVNGCSHLFDINEELLNAWLSLRDSPAPLQHELAYYAANDSEEFYYTVRPLAPEGRVARAARFIYLNQTSWNGLWRVNKFGQFNVPWGQRPFRGLTEETVATMRRVLCKVELGTNDFRDVLLKPSAGDFVYMDPPYLPISDTSKFYLYHERRFREPELRELADLCRGLTERGVVWMLSNRDTPLVRELFSHATIRGLAVRRSVAAQNRRDVEKASSPEVIIVGGGER